MRVCTSAVTPCSCETYGFCDTFLLIFSPLISPSGKCHFGPAARAILVFLAVSCRVKSKFHVA